MAEGVSVFFFFLSIFSLTPNLKKIQLERNSSSTPTFFEMVMASAPRRNVVLFAVVLTFLFSITYFRHAAYDKLGAVPEEFETPPPHTQPIPPPLAVKPATPSPHDAPQLAHNDPQTPPPPPPPSAPVLPSLPGVCDLVDFDWL